MLLPGMQQREQACSPQLLVCQPANGPPGRPAVALHIRLPGVQALRSGRPRALLQGSMTSVSFSGTNLAVSTSRRILEHQRDMSHLEQDAEHATDTQDSSKLLGHAHLQDCVCEQALCAASLLLLIDGSTTAVRLQRDGGRPTVTAAVEVWPGSMLGGIASRAVSCRSQQGQPAGHRLGALHDAAVSGTVTAACRSNTISISLSSPRPGRGVQLCACSDR